MQSIADTAEDLEVYSIYKVSPVSGPLADRVLTLMFRGGGDRLWFTGVRDTNGEWFFDHIDDIVVLELVERG